MTVQLQKQTEGDDKIMNELNQKVLQWKVIFRDLSSWQLCSLGIIFEKF